MFQILTPHAGLTSAAPFTSAEVLRLLWFRGFWKVLSLVLSLQNCSWAQIGKHPSLWSGSRGRGEIIHQPNPKQTEDASAWPASGDLRCATAEGSSSPAPTRAPRIHIGVNQRPGSDAVRWTYSPVASANPRGNPGQGKGTFGSYTLRSWYKLVMLLQRVSTENLIV